MKKKIPLEGTLVDYPPSELLSFILREKKTGALTLQNKSVSKCIYFKDGDVMFAASTNGDYRLGRLLLKKGKITKEQYNKSLGLLARNKKRLGDILLESGHITPPDLFQSLRYQSRKIVSDVLAWEEGRFSFQEGFLPEGVTKLNIKTDEVIRENAERMSAEANTAFIDKVNMLYEKLDTLSYHEILGVDTNARASDIRRKYLEKVKEFHPDRYFHLTDSSITAKLAAIIAVINMANDTLSDDKSRMEYKSLLVKGIQKNKSINNVLIAEEQFKKGLCEFRSSSFAKAIGLFQWAARLHPENASYWSYLSSALSSTGQYKEAEEAVQKAIGLEPYNAEYYVHLGLIYIQDGMIKKARQQFETALEWDPANKKANEELEKLRQKR
ncbi:MAG: DUF4388 domain-containing protein [Nitrospirae bacterium]|nr:DUF4388 domain-containing protein [Nitrospirota bacterium]